MSLQHVDSSAQQVDQYVINLAGLDFEFAGVTFEYSIGESVTTTISNGNTTITQGFLQPEIDIVIPCEDLVLNFFPNPVQERLYITDIFCGYELGEVEVIDLFGKTILIKEATEGFIDLSGLANGIYLVRVQSTDQTKMGTFKVLVAQS